MGFKEKEICKWGFHSCGNFKYDLCGDCDDGSNYEYFQDANTYEGEYYNDEENTTDDNEEV